MTHKPRSLRRQRALNRHHRRAARAARQANRGLYHTMTGEDKWGHEKRAFKRQTSPFGVPLHGGANKTITWAFGSQSASRFLPVWKPNLWKSEPLEEVA